MFYRIINPLESSSFFVFGARGTGKTTFIKKYIENKKCVSIDLLDPLLEDRFARNPNLLAELIDSNNNSWFFIDEIQKLPKLLDIIHAKSNSSKAKFILTGSSARKLKRGHANMLAGRAFVYNMFPITHIEAENAFNLEQVLNYGSLPAIFSFKTDKEKEMFLNAYSLTYMKEEIKEEQLVRNLDPFRKFLEVAAQCNSEVLNYTNIARDVGVDTKTVQSYFTILEDTLLGNIIEPYDTSLRKRMAHNPKFYFFDLGVKRALDGSYVSKLIPGSSAFGKAFEHFVITEIIRLSSYHQKNYKFSFIRTKDGAEVDLVIESYGQPVTMIEIKSKNNVNDSDVKNLQRFATEHGNCRAICISNDNMRRKIGVVEILDWRTAMKEL